MIVMLKAICELYCFLFGHRIEVDLDNRNDEYIFVCKRCGYDIREIGR